jgi:hypothetical protein
VAIKDVLISQQSKKLCQVFERVNDIAVTPDGRFAQISLFDFSGGTGGVWVVDVKLLKTVTVINTGDSGVFGMGTTPDGRSCLRPTSSTTRW